LLALLAYHIRDFMLVVNTQYTYTKSIRPYSYYPTQYFKSKWNNDLQGINYWGGYAVTQHLALSLDLSVKVSTRYSSQDYPYGANDAVFSPYTKTYGQYYTYTKPTTYLTCMLGICYMFNK